MTFSGAVRRYALLLAAACAVPAAQAYQIDASRNTVILSSLEDFDLCARETDRSEDCLKGLRAYADKKPADAFAAGKRARRNYIHWGALYFFDKALGKSGDATRCADPDVGLAVLSGLGLPSNYPAVPMAQRVLNSCWTQVKAPVMEEFKNPSSAFVKNTCEVAAKKNITIDRCVAPPQVEAKPTTPSVDPDVRALLNVDVKKLSLETQTAISLLGDNGEQVLMARADRPGPPLYLVKFKGLVGTWKDLALPAIERSGGINGKDYVTLIDGREWTVVVQRGNSYEAFPQDPGGTLKLYRTELRDPNRRTNVADVVNEIKR